MKEVASLVPILFILFSSCSFDYEEGKVAEDLDEQVPETILIDFVQVRTVEGKPDYRIYGGRSETFAKKKETVISDVLFQDFNSKGTIVTEASADTFIYFSGSEDVEMRGDLQLYNSEEEVAIESDYFFWNSNDQLLTAREDDLVTVRKKNGTVISGRGFTGKGKSKEIDFSRRTTGVWVEEESEEESEE